MASNDTDSGASSPLSTPPGSAVSADHGLDEETPSLITQTATMDIDALAAIISTGRIKPGTPEFQEAQRRQEQFDLLVRIKRAKRSLEEPMEPSPSKRYKSEFKYTNIEKLGTGSSLRRFSNWKADMAQLFKGSPEKFAEDSMRLVAAQQFMDNKAKTLWRAYLYTNPEAENWKGLLQWAQDMVLKGADAEIQIYQQYHNAKHRDNQPPVAFDAYLSSLEEMMGHRDQATSAMSFFTRLSDKLQAKMQKSGREFFPKTRQEMVAFCYDPPRQRLRGGSSEARG